MSTIPQSTTPRTDAAVRLTIGAGFNMVYPSFARELETELAAANECVAIANRSADDQMHQKREAQRELAATSLIAEKWEADALRYARNAEFWQSRAEKAEAELAATMQLGGFAYFSAQRDEAEKRAHNATVLAEKAQAEVERLNDCCDELHYIIDNEGYPSGKDYAAMQARAEKAEAETKQLINAGVNN